MAGKATAAAAKVEKGVSRYPWREKLARYKSELEKGVWGYWQLGAWKPLALSARHRARFRKEVLLAGEIEQWNLCSSWNGTFKREALKRSMKGYWL